MRLLIIVLKQSVDVSPLLSASQKALAQQRLSFAEEYIDDMLDVLNEVKDEHIILMSTGLLDIAHRISRDVVVLNNGELNLISYETMQIPVLDILGEADNEII